MTLQKRIIRLSPHTVVVFVAVIGIGLVAAVLLFTVLIPVLGGNSFDEPSPLFSVSEFPSTDETDDSAVMQLAAELLSSPQWTEGAVSLEDWNLTDNGPLTRGGSRIGIYADVRFEPQLILFGRLDFIRCGKNETWGSPDGEFQIAGLHIWLLDGESGPHNVLPLDQYGELSRFLEVESLVQAPVDCVDSMQKSSLNLSIQGVPPSRLKRGLLAESLPQ